MQALRDYFRQLQRSLRAVYACVEKPRIARRAVFALLAIHSTLLAYSAYVHSPTLNEPGHLVAGLSIWEFGRFDIYSVNPPLVKMVAALAVMAVGHEEDWSSFYSALGARPEFAMGKDFVAANGERSFYLFMIARWACIPFSWIGGMVCYLWARDLYGHPAGIVACSIWCFEPNILAHASLITPDAHATALGLSACYTFWRWLKKPTWSQAAVTGVVLGLAELAKTTLILFYPLWPLMWLIYRWPDRGALKARDWFREAGMLALRMAIGLYVLNLGYGFQGSFKPLGEFQFVSRIFSGTSPNDGLASGNKHPVAHNRFIGSPLEGVLVPFPASYLIGIDLQQRDFETYERPSYLRGHWRDRGCWYYYLYAAAVKVPLGLWALGVFALSTRQYRLRRPRECRATANCRDLFVLLAPPAIIFTVVSSKTGINEHMRYVLPCFPFLFVWASGFFQNFVDNTSSSPIDCESPRRTASCKLAPALPLTLLVWSFASSLWIYPHSLSYFNESIGGPRNGACHLRGSNVDWGQDLRYVHWWAQSYARGQPLALNYFGCCSARQFGLNGLLPYNGTIDDLRAGLYAISLNSSTGQLSQSEVVEFESLNGSPSGYIASHLPLSCGYSIPLYLLQRRD